jgi:hypothetical protein
VCRDPGQVGCIISFSTYPADSPPEEDAIFGRAGEPDQRAVCSDPVALSGSDLATAIIPTQASLLGSGVDAEGVDARYLVLPDVLQTSCERSDHHDYLAASLVPNDMREVDGLVEEFDAFGIQWGLHLLDANLAMGNLLDIVAQQSAAFAGSAA